MGVSMLAGVTQVGSAARVERELAHGSKVDLAGAERRDRFDEMQIFALGQPQPRQLGLAQPLPSSCGVTSGSV